MNPRPLLLLLALASLFGCTGRSNSDTDSNNSILQEPPDSSQSSTRQIPADKIDRRINLDSILADGISLPYLANLVDGRLGICCYRLLDITDNIRYSEFERRETEYMLLDKTIPIRVYRKNDSYIKSLYNDYQGANIWIIGSGHIASNEFLNASSIKIGLTKESFLGLFFKPSSTFDSIQSINIGADEAGGAWTEYHFTKDTLDYIQFGSYSSWIEEVE